MTKKIDRKGGSARIGAWSPSHYRPSKGPMIRNQVSLSGPQLGFAWLPMLIGAGRFLLPIAAGAGLYYAATKEDEKGEDKTTFGIENRKIAYSSIAAGISTAAFLGGGILPDDIRPIATIVGVLGAAASVAILFWPTEKPQTFTPQTPGPEIPPRECTEAFRLPMVSSEELKNMLTMHLDPEQRATGGLSRSGPGPHEFDFTIRNETDRALCFFVGLEMIEGNRSVFRSRSGISGRLGRIMVTLAAEESKSVRLATEIGDGIGPYTAELQIFRTRDDFNWLIRSRRLEFTVDFGFRGLQ